MTGSDLREFYNPRAPGLDLDTRDADGAIDPRRLRDAGLVSVCAPDRFDLDELIDLSRRFGGSREALTVSLAPYCGELKTHSVPALEFACLMMSQAAGEHALLVSSSGYAVFQPEFGEYHVIYGLRGSIENPLFALRPEIDEAFNAYLCLPHQSMRTRQVLSKIRAAYDIR